MKSEPKKKLPNKKVISSAKFEAKEQFTKSALENLRVITSVYEFIKKELSELQEETGCPDSFIYDFIGKIQNEWHPKSCHSIVRNKKRKKLEKY